MPTPYSPAPGSAKPSLPQLACTRNSCGIWIRMPAPSPVSGSQPHAPRCVEVPQDLEALLDDVVRALASHVDDEADAAGVVLGGRAVEAALARRSARACAHGAAPASAVRRTSSARVALHHREPRLLPSLANSSIAVARRRLDREHLARRLRAFRRRGCAAGGGLDCAPSGSCARSVCVESTTIVSVRATPGMPRIWRISPSSDDVLVGLHLEQQRVLPGHVMALEDALERATFISNSSIPAGCSTSTPMKAVTSRPICRESSSAW